MRYTLLNCIWCITIPIHTHIYIYTHLYIYTSDVIKYSEVHGHPGHVGIIGDSEVSALIEIAAVALTVGEL